MPSSTKRRRLLQAAGLSVLGGIAGCTSVGYTGDRPDATESPESATPTIEGTYADAPDGPVSYPDRPDRVTAETAREFARSFEHARTRNVLHRPNIETVSVDCRAIHDTGGHGGQFVLASCSGYANYDDGGHADWGQLPAMYFVGSDLAVRVEDLDGRYFDCNEVFASSNPEENFAEVCEGGDSSYRVYNLHPETHTVTVSVEFLDDSSPEMVLERTYEMGPTDGVLQGSVTYRRGTYRVTAALEGGPETSYRWALESEPSYSEPPVAVLVTPVGGVTVRRPPFRELRRWTERFDDYCAVS